MEMGGNGILASYLNTFTVGGRCPQKPGTEFLGRALVGWVRWGNGEEEKEEKEPG